MAVIFFIGEGYGKNKIAEIEDTKTAYRFVDEDSVNKVLAKC